MSQMKVYWAWGVLRGGGSGPEILAAAAAQHAGRRCSDSGAFGHHGGGKGSRSKLMPIHLVVTAERKFWRCVETGGAPALFGVEPPKPRIKIEANSR
jgi:hypothetical protein